MILRFLYCPVIDLGIVRDIKFNDNEVEVFITPTYSGCPAMDVISMNIRMALLENGFKKIKITQQLSPGMDNRLDD